MFEANRGTVTGGGSKLNNLGTYYYYYYYRTGVAHSVYRLDYGLGSWGSIPGSVKILCRNITIC
jgi:hypothetical protein